MPTRVKESSLFAPGKLVQCVSDIYSSPPIDGDADTTRITGGTVGVIISGPQPDVGYPEHYKVQFLKNIIWWVRHNEIEPYLN